MRYQVLWVVAALALGGCKGHHKGKETTEQTGPAMTNVTPVVISWSIDGNEPALVLGVTLFHSKEELTAAGVTNANLLGVDFTKNCVVVASLGKQNTAGYSIKINAVQQSGNDLYVQGNYKRPGAGEMVAQVMTAPFNAAVIGKTTASMVHPEMKEMTATAATAPAK